MLLLFETAAGFALFKVNREDKLEKIDDLYRDFESLDAAQKVRKSCLLSPPPLLPRVSWVKPAVSPSLPPSLLPHHRSSSSRRSTSSRTPPRPWPPPRRSSTAS